MRYFNYTMDPSPFGDQLPIFEAILDLREIIDLNDLGALRNFLSNTSSNPALASSLSSLPGEENNTYKLVNMIYNDYHNDYKHSEITLLYQALYYLLPGNKNALDKDVFNVIQTLLEFGALPFISDTNEKVLETTFATYNKDIVKLLYSFGSSPNLFDPLDLNQASIVASYEDNYVKYILQNVKPQFALQSLNNLHHHCEYTLETTTFLLTQPNTIRDERGFIQILNKDIIQSQQNKAKECLFNIDNALDCLNNYPELSGDLNLFCESNFNYSEL